MKKKLKLFLSISSLCFALSVLCFGVYSAQTVNYSLNGNVTYTVQDAFVEVQTKLYKSTTLLTSSQLGQKVNDIAEMDFTSTPDGLTLVDTSEVYSSTSGVPGTYEKPNLSYSTREGSECYAYFFVINIKNLSPDINVWAVMEDELTNPANTVQINNGLQQTIDQAGKNMVIGLEVSDFTQNIPTANNSFKYGIKIGVGDLATQQFNLDKLSITLSSYNNNAYQVKAKSTTVTKGVVVIPKEYKEGSNPAYPVQYLAFDAFSGCTGLTSIIIPEGVTTFLYAVFSGCTNLTSITIPSSVSFVSGLNFQGCNRLERISVDTNHPTYKSEGNCIIEKETKKLVAGCKSSVIPSSVTSISSGAFFGCTGLTSITIPSGVTSIGRQAFSGCTGLTSITIPNSVTYIPDGTFDGCTGLQYTEGNLIYIKNTNSDGTINKHFVLFATVNTTLTSCTISNECKFILLAFSNCTRLTRITIPRSVICIADYAFSGCTGLTSITIPSSVTSIGSSAFRSCTSLTSIEIPSSVTTVGQGAFTDCTSLQKIYVSFANEASKPSGWDANWKGCSATIVYAS